MLLLGAWSLLFARDGKNLRVVDHIHTPTLLRIVGVGHGPADSKQLVLSGSFLAEPAGDMASCQYYSRLLAKSSPTSEGRLPRSHCAVLFTVSVRPAYLGVPLQACWVSFRQLNLILCLREWSIRSIMYNISQNYTVRVLCTQDEKVSIAPHTSGPSRLQVPMKPDDRKFPWQRR